MTGQPDELGGWQATARDRSTPPGAVLARLGGALAAAGGGCLIAAYFPDYVHGAPLLGRLSLVLADLAWPTTEVGLGAGVAVALIGLVAVFAPVRGAGAAATGLLAGLAPAAALVALLPLTRVLGTAELDSRADLGVLDLGALDVGGQLAAGAALALVLATAAAVATLLRRCWMAPPAPGVAVGLSPFTVAGALVVLLVPPLVDAVDGVSGTTGLGGLLPALNHPLVAVLAVPAAAGMVWAAGYPALRGGAGAVGVLIGQAAVAAAVVVWAGFTAAARTPLTIDVVRYAATLAAVAVPVLTLAMTARRRTDADPLDPVVRSSPARRTSRARPRSARARRG